jgi:hypothetical protein
MEKEQIKEALKEVVDEMNSGKTNGVLAEQCRNISFSIRQINNGFLVEYWNGMGQACLFSETKEQAFEIAKKEFSNI